MQDCPAQAVTPAQRLLECSTVLRAARSTISSKSNMSTNQHAKVLTLGSGPAGYTAAIYAARANLNPDVGDGHGPGRPTRSPPPRWTKRPADVDGVQGPELMQRFMEHAERFKTQMMFDHIHQGRYQPAPLHADR